MLLQASTGVGSSAGLLRLEARTPTVGIVTRPALGEIPLLATKGAAPQGCAVSAPRCFEPASGSIQGLFLNVGSFFDRPRTPPRREPYEPRTTSSHFFVKLFESPTPDESFQIEGLGLRARITPANLMVTLDAAGVVLTDAENPYFPSSDDLRRLQEVDIVPAPQSRETCIDLTSADVVVEPGQAAWLVVRFPDVADSVFVGVLVDSIGPDHACDFLTRDLGDLWFRPDPLAEPPLDWGIAAYGQAVARKAEVLWSQVKRTYR